MKYRCAIYMEHTLNAVSPLLATDPALADKLVTALRQDQHDLFHDAEFADGCDICDDERENYS